MHQRTGNHQAALHAAGEHPRAFVALFPKIELFEVLFATGDGFFALNAVVARLVNDNLLYGFKGVKVELLRHQAELAFGVNHILLQVIAKHFPAPFGPRSA
ncbi:Uncharacterised protein [Klebsiella pneumoniae]|nr:Uncharacterised protein [Klebsiella pneumoniae]